MDYRIWKKLDGREEGRERVCVFWFARGRVGVSGSDGMRKFCHML